MVQISEKDVDINGEEFQRAINQIGSFYNKSLYSMRRFPARVLLTSMATILLLACMNRLQIDKSHRLTVLIVLVFIIFPIISYYENTRNRVDVQSPLDMFSECPSVDKIFDVVEQHIVDCEQSSDSVATAQDYNEGDLCVLSDPGYMHELNQTHSSDSSLLTMISKQPIFLLSFLAYVCSKNDGSPTPKTTVTDSNNESKSANCDSKESKGRYGYTVFKKIFQDQNGKFQMDKFAESYSNAVDEMSTWLLKGLLIMSGMIVSLVVLILARAVNFLGY